MVCVMIASMDGHHGDVSTLTVSSNGNLIFSGICIRDDLSLGARDNTIRVWDYKTHQCIREVKDRNSM